MSEPGPDATQLARATHIIRTYEQRAFPGGGSLLDRDPLYTRALLTALINDLEHYAAHHHLDITDTPTSTPEAADRTAYKVGDHVRLPRHGDHCGTVVGWTTSRPDASTTYLVEVPGIARVLAESATHLEPAPPFARTETLLGPVHYADQAEQTYISLAARIATADARDRRALKRDCDALIQTLSRWAGVPAYQLRAALNPEAPPAPPAARPSDTTAAAHEFPHHITQAIQAAPAPPGSRPTRQTRPHRGPAEAT
ncbi:hypothetical protein ACFYTC_22710 [Actinomadura nitritigenes]|uniref:hypothetical protein n=1 Tax=Actinomadura nitritigenes TaxID=134602 RepID=UPI003684FC99